MKGETVLETWTEKVFLCGRLRQLKIASCVPRCPFYSLSGQVECLEMWGQKYQEKCVTRTDALVVSFYC